MDRKSVIERYTNTTKAISDLIRYIGFGLVVVAYGLLTTKSDILAKFAATNKSELIAVMLIGILTIILDYSQYIFALKEIKEALKRADSEYDDESFWHKGSNCIFLLKQLCAAIGVILLFVLILMMLANQ